MTPHTRNVFVLNITVGFSVAMYLSAFRGYYPYFVDLHVPLILSAFRGYIRFLCISWIYPHFVDIVDISELR